MPDIELIKRIVWALVPDYQIPIWVCALVALFTAAVIVEIRSYRKHQ